MRNIYSVLFCLFSVISSFAQPISGLPPALQHQLLLQRMHIAHTQLKGTGSGHVFDTTRWNYLVDSTWGPGLPTSDKLTLFNTIWTSIDSTYAAFTGLPRYNWDSIANSMRAEISAGVSRGRFAAMLSHLRRYLNDGHTSIYDLKVNYPNTVYLGLPLMTDQSNVALGVCLTMLADSTPLVIDAIPNQPFGLQPGDIILGYNGIPWKDIVQIILKYELPNSVNVGSTEYATYQRFIKAAAANWYLFDTINIRKCNGQLQNLPTSIMLYNYYFPGMLCTDQMPIQGVHKLSFDDYYNQNRAVSAGIVKGTKIGYVYMMDCEDVTGDILYNAVKHLIEDSSAIALIFDLRTNYGGGLNAYLKTFMYLTGTDNTSWIGTADRVSVSDRYLMYNLPSYVNDIKDTDPHSFYRPIALLCGPEATSAGDYFQVLFRHHPWVKTFGRSTAGAFGRRVDIATKQADYYATKQQYDTYDVTDPNNYLSHKEYPIDFPVWLTKDSTCAGVDNVVSAAVKWINGELSVPTVNARAFGIKVYPNPANGDVHILFSSPSADQYTIRLCNIMGSVILQQSASAATGKIDLHCGDLPDGTYFLTVQNSNSYRVVQKISIVH
ncbi:MAG: T9SS type A sorting domain-containing protein [Bacteroidetes bacterium]|nr:T9SS type A sorting domain-containing protein [Bacteroidota bacterium]